MLLQANLEAAKKAVESTKQAAVRVIRRTSSRRNDEDTQETVGPEDAPQPVGDDESSISGDTKLAGQGPRTRSQTKALSAAKTQSPRQSAAKMQSPRQSAAAVQSPRQSVATVQSPRQSQAAAIQSPRQSQAAPAQSSQAGTQSPRQSLARQQQQQQQQQSPRRSQAKAEEAADSQGPSRTASACRLSLGSAMGVNFVSERPAHGPAADAGEHACMHATAPSVPHGYCLQGQPATSHLHAGQNVAYGLVIDIAHKLSWAGSQPCIPLCAPLSVRPSSIPVLEHSIMEGRRPVWNCRLAGI